MEPIDCVMQTGTSQRAFSLPKLAWVLLATYWLLLMLGTHLPGSSEGSPIIWDKLVHWAAYTGLALLLALVVQSRYGLNLQRYLAVFLIAGGYGAIDELAQLPIPGRHADFQDWIANLLGAASGLIVYRMVAAPIVSRLSRHRSRTLQSASPISDRHPTGPVCPPPHEPSRYAAEQPSSPVRPRKVA